MGLSTELIYPNQVMKLENLLEGQHTGQKGMITYIRKNGNQHTTKTPIMIPKVLAALLSFDSDILCFSSMNWYIKPDFLLESNITFGLGFEFEIVIVVVEVFTHFSEQHGFSEFFLCEQEEFSKLSVRESS